MNNKYGAIQFSHHNSIFDDKKYTIAVEVPPKGLLLNCVKEFTLGTKSIRTFRAGLATTHDNENYVKKTGREISMSRLDLVEFTLLRATIQEDVIFLTFDGPYVIHFKVSHKSSRVHLIT